MKKEEFIDLVSNGEFKAKFDYTDDGNLFYNIEFRGRITPKDICPTNCNIGVKIPFADAKNLVLYKTARAKDLLPWVDYNNKIFEI